MKLSTQARRMLQVILVINLAAGLISIIYYRSQEAIPFLLGLLLGSGASILRVILLERSVNKIVANIDPNISGIIGALGRLFLAFIVLLIGALVEGISLFGVIIGIFSYQIGTYALYSTLSSEQKNQLKQNNINEEKSEEEGR